jgi:hypothetical protein
MEQGIPIASLQDCKLLGAAEIGQSKGSTATDYLPTLQNVSFGGTFLNSLDTKIVFKYFSSIL